MITVTGSLAFDFIMDFPGKFSDHIMPDKIHTLNLSFLVNTLKRQKGGTAGNIAYNLALLQTPVSILGVGGQDFSPYGEFLKQAGVDISNIQIIDTDFSSNAFIMTDLSDNQITAFYPGVMNPKNKLSLDSTKTDLLIVSPNDPEIMVDLCLQTQNLNIPYLLDPGMQLPRLDKDSLEKMIKGAKILIGNDYEISLLSTKLQISNPKLLETIAVLITTLGENGSTIQTKDQTIQIAPAKPKEVIDPTGAGDAYRAGFLAGYTHSLDLKICGQMGSIASCYTVEKYGTTSHTFSLEEFKQRYQENFKHELRY